MSKDNLHQSPLVSVGIPTYNRADQLLKAVESIIDQDYNNLEIIISDNASQDNTENVCRKLCTEYQYIKYIKQEYNKGATFNFREVLKQSAGEYFMWLSDDDWLEHGYIKNCFSKLNNNLNYSIVSGQARYYYKNQFSNYGEVVNLLDNNPIKRIANYYQNVSDNIPLYGLMRRKQITNLPFRNTMGGDWLWVSSLAYLGKIFTCENTFINRNKKEYVNKRNYFENISKSLNLSSFETNNPHLSIALSNFIEILYRSPVFKDVNLFRRFLLAFATSKIIIEKNVLGFSLSFKSLLSIVNNTLYRRLKLYRKVKKTIYR